MAPRAAKRKRFRTPAPTGDNDATIELVSVVKTTLNKYCKHIDVRDRIEEVVGRVNEIRVAVGMLTKELLLTLLEEGEELPKLNQSFYASPTPLCERNNGSGPATPPSSSATPWTSILNEREVCSPRPSPSPPAAWR